MSQSLTWSLDTEAIRHQQSHLIGCDRHCQRPRGAQDHGLKRILAKEHNPCQAH